MAFASFPCFSCCCGGVAEWRLPLAHNHFVYIRLHVLRLDDHENDSDFLFLLLLVLPPPRCSLCLLPFDSAVFVNHAVGQNRHTVLAHVLVKVAQVQGLNARNVLSAWTG